jgi:hypothetical protein
MVNETIDNDKSTPLAPLPPAAVALADDQRKAAMLADEDPLLISQSLTYVTDDGGTLHSFMSAPFSTGEFAQYIPYIVCSFELTIVLPAFPCYEQASSFSLSF